MIPRTAVRTMLVAGLTAGALDLAAAIVTNLPRGISPVSIMQSIATGLLGRAAYEGGAGTALLGALLHFAMMFVIAAVFYLASRKINALVRHAIAAGVVYGVLVYAVMNFVVLPLSAFPHARNFGFAMLPTGIAIHVVCVGLPIAWVTRRNFQEHG